MAVYACIRALEVIGEAAKHIPEEFREKYLEIPWRNYRYAKCADLWLFWS